MSRNWTENQKLAIDSRDGSILVSAAAGSGKTAALVERVIRRITEGDNPTPIDRLLVVTYTKAATAELKMRIGQKLQELMAKNPGNPWYRRQLLHLPLADISTVDSFCGNIVREFAGVISAQSDYRIADESELSLMKRDAMRVTMEDMYSRRDYDFLKLVETFSGAKSDQNLEEYVFNFYKFLCSHPFADTWLKEKLSYYENIDDVMETVWGKQAVAYSLSAIEFGLSLTENSLEILKEEPELCDILYSKVDYDRIYLEKLREKLTASTYDEIRAFLETYKPKQIKADKFKEHPIKLKVAANRKKMKESSYTLIKSLFKISEKDAKSDIESLRPIASKLFETVLLYAENYGRIKQSKKVADFDDITHRAIEILVDRDELGNVRPSSIAREISDRYDEVMVDEYQDANEVQDLIYNCVSHNGKNLFVVGDVKQSIYGFRQAMPEIFLARKNSLPLFEREKNNYPSKVILEKNFRSRKEVTDYINFVFSRLMSTQIGDIEYNDEEKLVPAALYDPADCPCAELHLLDLSEEENPDQAVQEAAYIAELIHKMCSETYIKDGDIKRLVRYSDIAIIMRNTKNHAVTYVNQLKKLGIPAVCGKKQAFITSSEINLALSFLKIIDNPLQDIPLASVMMSPVYGFTPDDMAKVRAVKKKAPLFSALTEYAQSGDEKTRLFLEEINNLRTLSLTQPANVFINTLYDSTNLPAVASAAFRGNAEDNLRLLITYAEKFEQGASKGVSAFVDFLSRIETEGDDLPAAVDAKETRENCVRIMTIHSSKGLEFPVCIIADTHREFRSNSGDNVLLHSRLGFASKLRDNVLGTSFTTFPRDTISFAVKNSEMSEELRVLYVAMTRAKERLIMVASDVKMHDTVTNIAASMPGCGSILPFSVRNSKHMSDWLIMCALAHPDGVKLREYAGAAEPEFNKEEESGALSVIITKAKDEFSETYHASEISSKIEYEAVPENVLDIIQNRFGFEYEKKALCSIPQKVTASELAHKDIEKAFTHQMKKPKFLSDIPLTAAEKGTALHLFLEHCDYKIASENIDAEIERLKNSKILIPKQTEVIDKDKIRRFISSEIVSLALNSGKYYREYKFTVNIPASLVSDGLEGELAGTPVVLEGAVDLLIVDDSGIIVVDYKTDRVDDIDRLKDMYSKQLYLYKNAIEQIFKKPVKRCLIYSVYLSEIKDV